MPTSIKLDESLRQAIAEIARRRQRSPHSLMREAIRAYVAQEQAAERLRELLGARASRFEEDHRGVPLEVVAAWLGAWADPTLKAPACTPS